MTAPDPRQANPLASTATPLPTLIPEDPTLTKDRSHDASENGAEEDVRTSAWKRAVKKYQKPALGRATWQLVNTIVPYVLLWVLMYWSVGVSYWLTVPLAVVAGAFLVRVFIIFHDCGHGSFFKSKKANTILGFITGVLTLTPYQQWRSEHALHHATSGDLDRRGTGDVWTLTVNEYLAASRSKRLAYRLSRNPFVLFVLGPLFLFLIKQRFPSRQASAPERYSVLGTNLAILAMAILLSWLLTFKAYLLIQLIVMMVAGSAGIWLFYVQHQFEGVYWERRAAWDYTSAALQGSSFYKLPRVLQWFSGNIGYHHIHHLSPRVPNYHLEKCHHADPIFQEVKPVTLFSSFKSLTFRLWDEQRNRLVGYSVLRTVRREKRAAAGYQRP